MTELGLKSSASHDWMLIGYVRGDVFGAVFRPLRLDGFFTLRDPLCDLDAEVETYLVMGALKEPSSFAFWFLCGGSL